MHRWARVVILLVACGGSPPPAPSPTPIATAPVADAPADPPPPPAPPPASATIEHVLVAGPRPDTDIRARFEDARGELARCSLYADTSIALELRFAITSDGKLPHLDAFGDPPPLLLACVAKAVGSLEEQVASDGEPTDAYLLLALDVAGAPAAVRPSPPVLRDDFEEACSMFTRSGAMKADIADRPKLAQAYFRAKVRHPALHHMAWEIGNANPAVGKNIPKEYKKRAKPRTCEDPGW